MSKDFGILGHAREEKFERCPLLSVSFFPSSAKRLRTQRLALFPSTDPALWCKLSAQIVHREEHPASIAPAE